MSIWRVLWLIATAALSITAGYAKHGDSPGTPGEDIFSEESIPKLRITIAPAEFERLKARHRTYVPATVSEGKTVYTNVSIRLKGSVGSFRPLEDKPAFTLNFGRAAKGQKFHGLKKLHLNNSVQDHSYLAEKISRELFAGAGVPAPRAGHAIVELNGRALGFYVLIEGIDKRFLRRHFGNDSGNLYDGHGQADVNRPMHTNSGENRRDPSRLRALAAAAQEPDLDKRVTRLERTVDLDKFLSFLATEVMLCHWDGYAMNRNNYRIYHDVDRDRLVFLPQGTDQILQRQQLTLFPPMVGLVAKSVLEVPQLRERYRERVGQLLTNVWKLGPLTNHIYEVGERVKTSLTSADGDAAAGYSRQVTSFSRRLQQRVRSLQRELVPAGAEPVFDKDGILQVGSWDPQVDIGSPAIDKQALSATNALLHILCESNSAASWRSRILLDKGRYRFHGRVRLKGVVLDQDDAKAGAGLRISRHKFARQLQGDSSWTTVTFDFDVPQPRTTIELVCELRALKGEAWFDQRTLRVIRLE